MTENNLVNNFKPRAIGTPLAESGDKNTILDTSSDTGVVSIAKGFPVKFSAPRSDGGKSVARKDMNAMFNLLSRPEYFQQYMGRTLWDSGVASTGYPKGAKVWFYGADGSSAEYVSKVDDNKGTPGVSTDWVKTGSANGLEIDPSSGALSGYVSIGGTQTITGSKNFATSPTVPTVNITEANKMKAVNVGMLRNGGGSLASSIFAATFAQDSYGGLYQYDMTTAEAYNGSNTEGRHPYYIVVDNDTDMAESNKAPIGDLVNVAISPSSVGYGFYGIKFGSDDIDRIDECRRESKVIVSNTSTTEMTNPGGNRTPASFVINRAMSNFRVIEFTSITSAVGGLIYKTLDDVDRGSIATIWYKCTTAGTSVSRNGKDLGIVFPNLSLIDLKIRAANGSATSFISLGEWDYNETFQPTITQPGKLTIKLPSLSYENLHAEWSESSDVYPCLVKSYLNLTPDMHYDYLYVLSGMTKDEVLTLTNVASARANSKVYIETYNGGENIIQHSTGYIKYNGSSWEDYNP